MRKLVAVVFIVVLASGQPLVAAAKDLTAILNGYSQNQTALNNKQKNEIRKFVATKSLESLTCVGVTKLKPSAFEKKLAEERARTACLWLKQIPGLNKTKTFTATTARAKNFGVLELRLKTKVAPGSSPATTPAPTTTPSPIGRPSSPFYNYRIDATGRLERRGSLDARWYSDSASTAGISEVRTRAFNFVKSAKSDSGSASVSWVIGENVPKDMAAAYQSQMSDALNYFGFPGMKTPLEVLVVTELDRDLLREFWAPNIDGSQTAARYERGLDDLSSNQAFRSVSGGAESRTKRATLVTSVGITFMMGSKHSQETHLLLEHVTHELTHTWQFFAFGQTTQDPRTPGPNVMQMVPCHLTEGGANFLGAAVASPYADWYSEATDVIVRRVMRDLGTAPTSKSDVIALLNRSESWSDCQAGYGLGHLAYEWLVAEHGLQKYLALHSEIIRVSSLDQALQRIYGFGKGDFYEKASNYILSEIQKVS